MDKNPSKFFDKILSFLSSDYNRVFTIQEVVDKVYKKQINKINQSTDIDNLFLDISFEKNVINAIMFMNKEGLIAYDEKNKEVYINTKGFVKNKTENFTQEIRNKNINLWLQRSAWFCSIIALFISVYVLYSKSENSPTIVLDCNHKPQTTLIPSQPNHKSALKK